MVVVCSKGFSLDTSSTTTQTIIIMIWYKAFKFLLESLRADTCAILHVKAKLGPNVLTVLTSFYKESMAFGYDF